MVLLSAKKLVIGGSVAVAVAALCLWLGVLHVQRTIGPPPLDTGIDMSRTVLDRNGRLLRAYTAPDGRWRLGVSTADVDPKYVDMLLAFEDRRFFHHGGVDALAVLRAAAQFAANGRIISGASTLTMQVARLIDRHHARTASGKIAQMARALQIEDRLGKRDILDVYLRLAPFGGNIEGVRAASLTYFGKEPKRLSIAEAALLVALPQSPEARRPDRNSKAARIARARVLDRAFEAGVITASDRDRAKDAAMPDKRRAFPRFAAHLADRVIAAAPTATEHRLTVDLTLQSGLERLVHRRVAALGEKLTAAIIVVDTATGELRASVGSSGLLAADRLGAIDMTQAIRSPGSTLKPFVYGLGFEFGLAHPQSLIEDRPVRFGRYAPKNFDEGYRGTVSIRTALAQSLNVPAVKVLNAVGPARLVSRLKRLTANCELPDGVAPTLAVALGGIGMTLHDLATLYTSLARGGAFVQLTHRQGEAARQLREGGHTPTAANTRLMSEKAAGFITDILRDAPPPANATAGAIAYKTGTSYGYRDALAIGFDGQHTIAVWVGRADGTSTPELTGRTAAAPLLFDAFAHAAPTRTDIRSAFGPQARTPGQALPHPLKRFREPGAQAVARGPYLTEHLAIAFPPDRSELANDDHLDAPMVLSAEGGALPLTWLVNGRPVSPDASDADRRLLWQPPGPGFVTVTVLDASGQSDRVTVRLK